MRGPQTPFWEVPRLVRCQSDSERLCRCLNVQLRILSSRENVLCFKCWLKPEQPGSIYTMILIIIYFMEWFYGAHSVTCCLGIHEWWGLILSWDNNLFGVKRRTYIVQHWSSFNQYIKWNHLIGLDDPFLQGALTVNLSQSLCPTQWELNLRMGGNRKQLWWSHKQSWTENRKLNEWKQRIKCRLDKDIFTMIPPSKYCLCQTSKFKECLT